MNKKESKTHDNTDGFWFKTPSNQTNKDFSLKKRVNSKFNTLLLP